MRMFLPDVFRKVVEAKQYLVSGAAIEHGGGRANGGPVPQCIL